MSNKEFCSGVKMLLERMETNPEDFEMLEYDASMMHSVRGKFYEFGKNLESIVSGQNKADTMKHFRDWHIMTKEEHNALIAGYKEMRRKKFDADVLTRLMDTDYVQRQKDHMEAERQNQYQQIYMKSQQARIAQAQLQPMVAVTTSNNTNTITSHPAQGSTNYHNTGLLGTIGASLGLTK